MEKKESVVGEDRKVLFLCLSINLGEQNEKSMWWMC